MVNIYYQSGSRVYSPPTVNTQSKEKIKNKQTITSKNYAQSL